MKKKRLQLLLAFTIALLTTPAKGYECHEYRFLCSSYISGAEGGGVGIACGSVTERTWQMVAHTLDNCFGYENALDFFPTM